MTPELRKGFYQHYKGPYYEVLDLVRHSETDTWHVLYRTCYGDWGRWVRPYDMFTGMVEVEGRMRPRFAWVSELPPEGVQRP